ncbi:hypothetical protein NA56DRAFT_643414 [Hyaloscypha hepaticicola]|uniref:AGA1 A-agglutinin anchor subunit n=1 Tax=Hyaloscypha hepaticicola TaxID=2082293 RepID=A0A2J6QD24_9HELO|nr:hypothetical protein NA56DRAFT_643414 [Hyaloscypha hepaticicola]
MSALPSRTRSLRKPAEAANKYQQTAIGSSEGNTASWAERTGQSPSRLPKPPTRTLPTRPPSSTGSVTSNVSTRPPPSRANISKPAAGALQRSSSGRRPNPPTTDSEPVKKDRSRPPLTQSRHLRNASASSLSASTNGPGHSRTRSPSTLLTSSTALRPLTRNGSDDLKVQPQQQESQLRRPAFSTLQQHFSPAKNLAPKPHPAAFLAPPSPSKLPSNIAISAETAKLQNELLQLHLLHKDAAQVDREWRASAKRKLGARFQSVVDRNETLVQLEVEETGKINAAALKRWQELGTPGWGLEQKIQALDEVISGVWNLGGSGGKYERVVRRFEKWLIRCQDILGARAHDEGLEDDECVFLEELDAGWKDDCLILSRKLESWRDRLEDLGTLDSGSSLAVVVDRYRSLVSSMLMELNVMAQIERDAMDMEAEWIKSMNDDVLDDKDTPVAGAIWRTR